MLPFNALLVLALFLAGCAGVSERLSPSMEIVKDEFDGSTVVRQPPVTAAKGMRDAWHTLGFEWSQKAPNFVYLTAGASGNIADVAFNADGRLMFNLKTVGAPAGAGRWTTRRFVMSWEEFAALANAKDIRMRVTRDGEHTVSSFGPAHPSAAVNTRLTAFVTKVRELRAETLRAEATKGKRKH